MLLHRRRPGYRRLARISLRRASRPWLYPGTGASAAVVITMCVCCGNKWYVTVLLYTYFGNILRSIVAVMVMINDADNDDNNNNKTFGRGVVWL
jgi:hypothetical protein